MKGLFLRSRAILVCGACILLFALPFIPSCRTNDQVGSDVKSVFSPSIGVCTSVGNCSKVKTVGYDYIEEGVGRFLVPTEPEEKFLARYKELKECGFKVYACNSFLPGSLKSVGPAADHDGVISFARTAFERANRAGVKMIVFGSSGSRGIPDGFPREQAKEQFVGLLRRMGPVAAENDIVVCIEPLNRGECNFINSLAEGAEIVELTGHPNIQLLADMYHMAREGEGPEEIIKAGRYLRHCHIAENKDRAAPGTYGEDFTGYFAALKKIGYKGGISIECRWSDFSGQLSDAAIYMTGQIETVNKL